MNVYEIILVVVFGVMSIYPCQFTLVMSHHCALSNIGWIVDHNSSSSAAALFSALPQQSARQASSYPRTARAA